MIVSSPDSITVAPEELRHVLICFNFVQEKRQLHFWFKEHVGGHSQSQAEGVVEKFYRDLMTDKESFPPGALLRHNEI